VKVFPDGTPTLSLAGHVLWTFTLLGVGLEGPKVYYEGAQALDGVHSCVIYRGGACAWRCVPAEKWCFFRKGIHSACLVCAGVVVVCVKRDTTSPLCWVLCCVWPLRGWCCVFVIVTAVVRLGAGEDYPTLVRALKGVYAEVEDMQRNGLELNLLDLALDLQRLADGAIEFDGDQLAAFRRCQGVTVPFTVRGHTAARPVAHTR